MLVEIETLDELTIAMIWRLLGFARFVRGGQHMSNVGGQEVVHLVAQGGLAQQLGPSDQVPDGHMEVGVAT